MCSRYLGSQWIYAIYQGSGKGLLGLLTLPLEEKKLQFNDNTVLKYVTKLLCLGCHALQSAALIYR